MDLIALPLFRIQSGFGWSEQTNPPHSFAQSRRLGLTSWTHRCDTDLRRIVRSASESWTPARL